MSEPVFDLSRFTTASAVGRNKRRLAASIVLTLAAPRGSGIAAIESVIAAARRGSCSFRCGLRPRSRNLRSPSTRNSPAHN